MRVMTTAALLALVLVPASFSVQTQALAAAHRFGVHGITRQTYIEHSVARSAKYANRRFDAIDTAHKGVITRDQYVNYYKKREETLAEHRFDQIDSNHDGILEPSEIAAWRAAHPQHPAKPAK